MRIYVAVTSINPIRLYVHEEGLVRFATEKYSTENVQNRFAHLTNYSINKTSATFVASGEEGEGSKWTI